MLQLLSADKSKETELIVRVLEDNGLAQVPSPLQNVEDEALVPLFKLVTGKLPVTPVDKGNPVAFVNVTLVGVPNNGVTNVGDVANTNAPEPVSSVTALAKLAEVGVAKNVATPVPKPDTPVLMGKPVAFVKVPLDGVPKAPPFTTTAPDEPVLTARAVATPVPNPLTPVEIGKPVPFVNVTLVGVPNTGVTRVGDVENTKFVDVVPVAPDAV